VRQPKMVVKKIFVFWLIWAGSAPLLAQDIHFSQQYAGRLFLNPAFAGAKGEMRAVSSYRNQWPSLSGGFVGNQLSGEYRFKDQGSALGLAVSTDRAGQAGFTRLQLGGMYAYHLRLSENVTFGGGLQGSYGSQRVDFASLVFGDQLSEDGQIRSPSAEVNVYDPVSYLSVSAGGLLYTNAFWVGAAAYHLNQPDLGSARLSELPLKLVANAGYKFTINSYPEENRRHEFSVTPTLTYTRQGQFQKTDLALYTTYSPVSLGVLYRGITFGPSLEADRSVAAVVGFTVKSFKVGYSYDVTVAGFGAKAGGSHELSLIFEKIDYDKMLRKQKSRKNYNQIACPAF
jgi:type IX secretion system PorP/SprF family membrane protein